MFYILFFKLKTECMFSENEKNLSKIYSGKTTEQTDIRTDKERKQNVVHIVHITTHSLSCFMRLALIVFKLSKDPDF